MGTEQRSLTQAIGKRLEALLGPGGWAVITWVGAVAVIRYTGADSTTWMIGLVGLTPLLMVPIHPVLGMAIASRRRAMAAVALVLAVAHLGWTLPEWRAAGPAPEVRAGDVTLKVFSANVFLGNPDVSEIGREMLASDADVIVLQELTPWQVRIYAEVGLMSEYPFQILMPRRNARGSGMMSRLPFSSSGFRDIEGSQMAVATVDAGGVLVDIVGVHVQAPVFDSARRLWADQLRALADMVEATDRPLILAGDFNSTLQHDNLREVGSAGARDALVVRGKGWIATWPRGRVHPPILRLDHIFATDDIEVVDAGVGEGPGSDHRPIWAEFIVGRSAAS